MKVKIIKKVDIDEGAIACGIYTSVLESIDKLIGDYLISEEEICEELATEAVENIKPNEMVDIIQCILTIYKTQNSLID